MSTSTSIIYLDHNATTPLHPIVKSAIVDSLCLWANPSSQSRSGKSAKSAITNARTQLANLLSVDQNDIIFTSGGTEANNWVIQSCVQRFRHKNPSQKAHIITSNVEHPAINQPLANLERNNVCDVSYINVDSITGQVCPVQVLKSIQPNTCLVTIMMANNETGVIQPIADIGAGIARLRETESNQNVMFHSDAAQAIGKMQINCDNVDYLTVVGHKFYGPRIGALYARNRNIESIFYGGGQEGGLRPGTENTPMIVGLGAAASLANQQSDYDSLLTLRQYFEQKIQEKFGSKVIIHFKQSARLVNTSNVAFTTLKQSSNQLLAACQTFAASTGAACHSTQTGASSILMAHGIAEHLAARSVRFSVGRSTTESDIDVVIEELEKIVPSW